MKYGGLNTYAFNLDFIYLVYKRALQLVFQNKLMIVLLNYIYI